MSVETEIRSILHNNGIAFKDGSHKSFILDCPICNKEDKLYIRKRDGRFVCWVCKETQGFQGKPEYALKEILGRPLEEVKKQIYGKADIPYSQVLEVSFEEDVSEDNLELPLPEVAFPLHFVKPYGPALEYLAKRGIPEDSGIAEANGLKYDPLTKRIIFPIKKGTHLMGWQARSILSEEERTYVNKEGQITTIPKILSNEELSGVRDRVIGFWDRLQDCDHAILCEGPFDALKAHLCGGNVFTMGKEISKFQIDILLNSGIKKLYLGQDPDAMESLLRIVKMTCSDLEVYQMNIPPKTRDGNKNDLGEMSFEEVYDLYRTAQRVNSSNLFVYLTRA